MISLESLRDLYDYNYWARDQQFDVCRTLSHEELGRPLTGSFGSIRDTLTHLLGAECLWLERFCGRSPRALPPWMQETQNLETIRARWQEVERGVRACAGELTPNQLAGMLTYQNLKGETWSYPLWQALVHLNRGTYHRGQLTTALRLLAAIDLLIHYDNLRQTTGVLTWQPSD
jgi:uncharacterized damage-inducible protein DinB